MIELDNVTPMVSVKEPASNTTNVELMLIIDNDYPGLQGPLKMMAERFRDAYDTQKDYLPKEIQCPACGTQLGLSWDIVK